jgi:hypothetical protein
MNMSNIVTGSVTGLVDTSDLVRDAATIRRELALETGDVRRDVAKESHHVTDDAHRNADSAARDASANAIAAGRDAAAYYIADVAAQTQFAKDTARSQAWTEAKIDSGFIKVAGDTALSGAITNGHVALEAARSNGINGLAHAALGLQIAHEAAATRSMLQAQEIANLREKAEERYMKIVELEGDRKHCDRDYQRLDRSMQQNQWASLQSQLQMFGSDLQNTKQAVNNFGSGTATGGVISSNHA